MKLKKGIVTGEVDGENFAIATGKAAKNFNGMIHNNATANYIFELLKKEQTEDSIVEAMAKKYDAPIDVIRTDVKEVLETIKAAGILDE